MRKKIFTIIDVNPSDNYLSKAYNILNIVVILLSLLPLMYHVQTPMLKLIDQVTVTFFIVEYFLHLFTADFKYPMRTKVSAFLTYPISPLGIIDLLSILPSFAAVNSTFRLLRLFRLLRSLRVFRAFKLLRYSKSARMLVNTIRNQKNVLTLIVSLTLLYILISALIMFNVEPEQFPSFLDAVYWSTMSLTTSTYGNYYPNSLIGQFFTQISFLIGVIIIALPSSIITAGYVAELDKQREILDEKQQVREQLMEEHHNNEELLASPYVEDDVYFDQLFEAWFDKNREEINATFDLTTSDQYDAIIAKLLDKLLEERKEID